MSYFLVVLVLLLTLAMRKSTVSSVTNKKHTNKEIIKQHKNDKGRKGIKVTMPVMGAYFIITPLKAYEMAEIKLATLLNFNARAKA